MHIIVGLGNPGREYENTRHNVGFSVLDDLARKNNISVGRLRFKALCGEGFIGGKRVLLLKPQTYMNLSGESVLDAVHFYKADADHLIVIVDDVDLPLGRIRIRPSGSDGGHNGIKSIIGLLGTERFARIRVGIGHPKYDMVDYVLGSFSGDESRIINEMINLSSDAAAYLVENGVGEAMNRYNSYQSDAISAKDI